MAFADLAKKALDFAVAVTDSELTEYVRHDGEILSLRAQIDREPERLGFGSDLGKAIVAHYSLTDLSDPKIGREFVRLESGTKTFRVTKEISREGGGLELYCTAT